MMTEGLPKISIVTPSFNQSGFLERTILSVLEQGYPNLEYIVIDGGSTDGSVEIIRKHEKHLAYWVSEKDAGQYNAINKGLARATGEVMAWINGDNIYCPNALRTVGTIIRDCPQVQWLTSLFPSLIDYHGFSVGVKVMPGYSQAAYLDGRYLPARRGFLGWIQQESTFWRRSLWQQCGGRLDEEFGLAGDFELWGRMFARAELVGVPALLCDFRLRDGQRSSDFQLYVREAQQALERHRRVAGWRPARLRAALLKLEAQQIPKLRNWLRPAFGYRGKKLVRQAAGSPQARWVVTEYLFP